MANNAQGIKKEEQKKETQESRRRGKKSAIYRRRHRKSRNGEQPHHSSFGNSMTQTSRDLTIAKGPKLRASSRILKSIQSLLATVFIMTTKFQISKREQKSDCSRSKRAKTRSHEGKKGVSNRRVKRPMFIYFEPFLLIEPRVLNLIALHIVRRSPSASATNQRNHFDINDELIPIQTGNRIMQGQDRGGRKNCKIATFFGRKMRVLPTQFMIIVYNLEIKTPQFLSKSKLNTIMGSTIGLPCIMAA